MNSNPTDFKTATLQKYNRNPNRPKLDVLLNRGEDERAAFQDSVEFVTAGLKTMIALTNTFTSKTNEFISMMNPKNIKDPMLVLSEFENEYTKFFRNLLQKMINVLSTFRIYEENILYFDLMTKPANIVASGIINLRPKFQKEMSVIDYMKTNNSRLGMVISNMVLSFRGFIALQLFRRQVLTEKLQSTSAPTSAHLKKWKTIKVLLALQKFIVDQSETQAIIKGYLLKKSKDGTSYSKNWKKYYFKLEHERLLYSEKEGDKNQKVVFTNTFSSVKDASNDTKKPFSFQIMSDNPIVLCASCESEFQSWVTEVSNLIVKRQLEENFNDKDLTPDWNVFTEDELFQLLRSVDKEEKYHVEMIRLLHLESMQKIAQSMATNWRAPVDEEKERRIKRYIEEKSERLKYVIMASKDEGKTVKEIQQDPTEYLSVLSGYNTKEFKLHS